MPESEKHLLRALADTVIVLSTLLGTTEHLLDTEERSLLLQLTARINTAMEQL